MASYMSRGGGETWRAPEGDSGGCGKRRAVGLRRVDFSWSGRVCVGETLMHWGLAAGITCALLVWVTTRSHWWER